MTGVAPIPVGTISKYETEVSGSDIIFTRPAAATTGMTLVVGIRTNASNTAADYSCSGFTHRGHPFIPNDAAGRVLSLFTHYISDINAEPATYTFVNATATGRRVGLMQAFSNVDSTNPSAGSDPGWNAAGKPTILLNSFSVDTTDDCLLIYAWGNEVVSPNATAPTAVPGTMLGLAASRATTDATRSVMWMGYEPIAASTAGPESLTWASSSGESAIGFVLRGLSALPPAVPKFSSVAQFLATKGATAIHRAPTGFTQSSIDTLQKASVQGFSAFEMSVGFSSDLKPFLSGFQYLDPLVLNAATTTLDPLTLTWASISSTYQNISGPTTQPLALLEDALAATVDAGLGIAIVDPKYGFATLARVNAMLDVCDAHGGPSKILIKFDNETTNTVLVTAAHARGYTCINYWGSDTANLAIQQANWDVLGGLYNAGSTMWNALKSYGKKTWAAIVPNQAALDQAVIDTDADFYMVQSLSITPIGPGTPEPSTYSPKTNRDLEIAWLREVSGVTASASVEDLRQAVYGTSERAYWVAKSGLLVGSLADHKLAAMKADTGATGSLVDVSRVYWAKNSA
jgi:hypothetical protein